jgi:hypothetical protein
VSRRRPFKFTLVFKVDPDFSNWFADLKNADQAAFEMELQKIARDDQLGASPASRLGSAARARRTAAWLSFATMLITFWAFVYPRPYVELLSLCAALPIIAILLCWKFSGLFTLTGQKQSARGDLTAFLIGPSIVLAMRAMFDLTLVKPVALLVPSAVGAVVLTWSAWLACKELRRYPTVALIYALFFGLYAAGSMALANSLLDWSNPNRELATIIAMRHTTGKGATAYFSLSHAPVGLGTSEISVPFGLYRSKHVGDLVCVSDHAGALGWRWVRVDELAICLLASSRSSDANVAR